jgi:hypothetical protein
VAGTAARGPAGWARSTGVSASALRSLRATLRKARFSSVRSASRAKRS